MAPQFLYFPKHHKKSGKISSTYISGESAIATDWKTYWNAIDQCLREGNGAQARNELLRVSNRKIPRRELTVAGALASRANLPQLCVRWLHPIVHPTKKMTIASDGEKVEYAAGLIRIGVPEEALDLLRSVNTNATPQALFYTAAARIAQWDYAPTIDLLSRYIQSPGITHYQRLIGKVNLAAAYIHESQYTKAKELIDSLLGETNFKGLWLLHGNLLKLSAQNAFAQRDLVEAERCVERAATHLAQAGGRDEFYVQKWHAVIALFKTAADRSSVALLEKLRERAREQENWETLRDCDRYEAICRKDQSLFLHLYYGTPFDSFRKELSTEFKQESITAQYTWKIGQASNPNAPLNLLSGQWGPKAKLKVGQAPHRLLIALCSDFYRPFGIPALHAKIYSEEYFNPLTSPAKVHRVIARLRVWFDQNGVPITVAERKEQYRLEALGTCHISITRPDSLGNRFQLWVNKLKDRWGEQPFSNRDARGFLQASTATTQRILNRAEKEGLINRFGRKDQARYRFKQAA